MMRATQYAYGISAVTRSRWKRTCGWRSRAATVIAPLLVSVMPAASDHGRDDLLLGDVVASELGADPSVVQDDDAVAQRDQLAHVGRVEEDRHARVRLLAHEVEDLGLRAHVDAAGRVVHEEEPRLQRQHAPEQHLLLVP